MSYGDIHDGPSCLVGACVLPRGELNELLGEIDGEDDS